MPLMNKAMGVCLLLFCLLCFANASANAQTNKQTEATDQQVLLKTLINEVRQLRIAIERNSLNSFRTQIAVERLRAQQEIVIRLKLDLAAIQQEMRTTNSLSTNFAEKVKEVEKKVSAGLAKEEELAWLKRTSEEMYQRLEDVREREISLTQQVNLEVAKLDEFNKRLDALERILDAIQNEEKPNEEKPPQKKQPQ